MKGFFYEFCIFFAMNTQDILIVGGGLAGLTAAIHLAGLGHAVALFETKEYPHHKVCGEYISNEVLPYLDRLDIDIWGNGAQKISDFKMSSTDGKEIGTKLPLGGFGMSRFALDHLLYQKAKKLGVQFYFEKAVDIRFSENRFTITTHTEANYHSKTVIGAYGKRSVLDKTLQRDFINDKNAWLAVKAHYQLESFPEGQVALHNFEGGYGGLSKTETGAVNFCYLAHYDSFKKHNSIEKFNERVVSKNPHLEQFLTRASPLFKVPLTIAQISFGQKEPVLDHILMCGDTAGLIHPLCGNGMAMAIHSAKLASECIDMYLSDDTLSRSWLEQEYQRRWNKTFKKRLWFGRKLQNILLRKRWANFGVATAGNSKPLLKYIIAKTHGKPIA
ncbi:NAD(P)/FAD-dependent oxidoreductase [Maribacter sp. 2210JD10-5]|uniref:NAD(P)/FAD-dependent oxidoreductase n=1 Tax=Maribacter sp. 2210JD10-5 TaxID=3386272 RepID=UPI0039BC2882